MELSDKKLDTAVFAMGCFWCSEAIFKRLKGVKKVTSGYAGGDEIDPNYESVGSGMSGHAEAIKIEFDPKTSSYATLLEVFFLMHDPTTLNRQGNDMGPQYRSMILYANVEQKEEAQKAKEKFQKLYKNLIVTEIEKLGEFYIAEQYHIDFYENNPDQTYCRLVIDPKLAKLREKFSKLLIRENK